MVRNIKDMIQSYCGHYKFNKDTVANWNSKAIGVYYCGYLLNNGDLFVLYVGKATSDNGIRGRLLQHLDNDRWLDVSYFGYCQCSSQKEAEDFEAIEIKRWQPKYNILGK